MKKSLFVTMVLISATFLNVSKLGAQAPLRFEVASIKLADPRAEGAVMKRLAPMGCHGTDSDTSRDPLSNKAIPLGRCVFESLQLRAIVMAVYQVEAFRISGGPAWITSDGYHIEAKAESPATVTELRQMMENLLADRFKLQFQRVTKEMAGGALVVAKNGAKLKEAASDEEQKLVNRNLRPSPMAELTGQHVSMAMLANQITAMAMPAGRGPTVDRTGLPGFYDFKVTWQPEGIIGGANNESAGNNGRVGPTFPIALEEQLGLRLETQKNVPFEMFVIGRVERPTEP